MVVDCRLSLSGGYHGQEDWAKGLSMTKSMGMQVHANLPGTYLNDISKDTPGHGQKD